MKSRSTRVPALNPVADGDVTWPRGGIHLVVGHDGRAASDAALTAALSLAQQLRAHLHVMHCVTLAHYGIDPDTDEFEAERDRNLVAERESIAGRLADAATTWSYHEAHGDPAHELAKLAASVDAAYIVVGASHRGVLRHLLGGGPVGQQLSHLQGRPIVLVPEPPKTR